MKKQLDKFVAATGPSKVTLAVKSFHSRLEEQARQVREIKKAIKEADAGDFATAEEAEKVFKKYLGQ